MTAVALSRNASRRQVTIPPDLVYRASQWAAASFQQCKNGRLNRFTEETGVTSVEFFEGKRGEVAFALLAKLNIEEAVKWSIGPDSYFDMMVRSHRVDVKSSLPPFCLIWPRTKNEGYDSRPFDALVSVSVDRGNHGIAWVEGFVWKSEFKLRKLVATGEGRPRLRAGTWYMFKSDLQCIDSLLV